MPSTQIATSTEKPPKAIKHTPTSFERANWRVNDFLTWFAIGRSKFYELVNSGEIKVVKCGSTTLIPHREALAFQERLERNEV